MVLTMSPHTHPTSAHIGVSFFFKSKSKKQNSTHWIQDKQEANHKSAMPYCYLVHVAKFGWLSNQDQTLAHFRDHLISTVTCNWTSFEERVTNTICG